MLSAENRLLAGALNNRCVRLRGRGAHLAVHPCGVDRGARPSTLAAAGADLRGSAIAHVRGVGGRDRYCFRALGPLPPVPVRTVRRLEHLRADPVGRPAGAIGVRRRRAPRSRPPSSYSSSLRSCSQTSRCTARSCCSASCATSTGSPRTTPLSGSTRGSRESRSRLKPFVKLARTIRQHKAGVLAAIELDISNGRLEELNSRVRLISHRAHGFHSADALIAMVYLCCAGITITLPHQ